MSAAKQQVLAAAAALGGSLDEASYQAGAFVVDAPEGAIWSASQTHAMREEFSNGSQTWEAAAALAIIKRMRDGGTETCEEGECDICERAIECEECERGYGPGARCRCNDQEGTR